jgi:hypothetical protein
LFIIRQRHVQASLGSRFQLVFLLC